MIPIASHQYAFCFLSNFSSCSGQCLRVSNEQQTQPFLFKSKTICASLISLKLVIYLRLNNTLPRFSLTRFDNFVVDTMTMHAKRKFGKYAIVYPL